MPHPTWPFFNLAIRTPMVELRPVDEALGVQLALLADRGIHPRGEMPFCVPWTDIDPPERYWASMQFYWRCWGSFTAQDWHLPFATLVDGEVVGMQEVAATGFVDLGVIRTGSWIGQEFQGRGIGREQRAAVLHFAFDSLGARRAESAANHDNPASLGVSRSLGYRENGDRWSKTDGYPPVRQVDLVLDREAWEPQRRDDIVVTGAAATLPLFGLA
ncbi:MAG: GNAT family N-acetyltransferase [Microthrixaceae bacterium]|nr:GNAT family N-acetyltransferase [Actinomycetota bacterium]